MVIIIQILLGLIFGSFLNVLIWRLNIESAPKFWQGRSICPNCRHQLSWHDNIPLLSFILLKGKCRYCKKNISWQYPVVELTTAIAFGLTGFNPVIFVIILCFIVIFFSDLIYGTIPDLLIIIGVLASFWPAQNLLVAIISALPFLTFAKLKWMGEGDIGLAFLMGLLLGFPKILVAFWFAFVIGGIIALILLVLRKTKISATIPLGPFLIIGTIIAALWSNELIRYLNLSL